MDDEAEQKKSCTSCNDNTSKIYDEIAGPACLDYKKTVIAQYSNSPVMLSLLDIVDREIKVCGFFDDFYRTVWNINTAEGVGLDIWGRIVGVNRKVRNFMGVYWGFYEESLLIARPYHDTIPYHDDNTPYNDGLYDANLADDKQSEQYYSAIGMFRDLQGKNGKGEDLMEDYQFDDNDFRKMILAKAYANISDYSISSINYLLMALLTDNQCCKNCCKNYLKECCTSCCKDSGSADCKECCTSCCKDSDSKDCKECCTGCCKDSDSEDCKECCTTCCEDQRSIYILDNLDMTLTIQLNWLPTEREVALIYNTGLLSRPAGVALYEIDIQVKEK